MRFVTSCGLLVALAATAALAQTRPKKSATHRSALRPKATAPQPEPWMKDDREPYPYLPEDFAQIPAPEPSNLDKVYTYVEQMPLLDGQGSYSSLTTAIQQRLVLPLAAPAGRTFVQFVVTKEGTVTKVKILKGLRADVDSAVVTATRKLPHFKPGKQAGQVVAVSYTLAVPIGTLAGAKPIEPGGRK